MVHEFFNASTSVGGTVNNWNYYVFNSINQVTGGDRMQNSILNTVYGVCYSLSNDCQSVHTHTWITQNINRDHGCGFRKKIRGSPLGRETGSGEMEFKRFAGLSYRPSSYFTLFWTVRQPGSICVLTFINRADDGSDRNLYIDYHNNWGNEAGYCTNIIYPVLFHSTYGFRYYNGHTHRE